MTHYLRKRYQQIAALEADPITGYSWQENITIIENVSALFDHFHTQFRNHRNNLYTIRHLFINSYQAAKETANNKELELALITEFGSRLDFKTNEKSPSRVDRAALTLIQSACTKDPNLIPFVIDTLLGSEGKGQGYKLNNLISVMESPAAVMKFLLTLYKKTDNSAIKKKITGIIQAPFYLHTDEAIDDPYPFYESYYNDTTIVIPNRYSTKKSNFFNYLTSLDVSSVITLIREGILLIPSEEATALAHRLKSQVVAEILGLTKEESYNGHHSITRYTDEERFSLLKECAKQDSNLRRFSDIPTTSCFWRKRKQTRSSQTLQAAAADAKPVIIWEHKTSNTPTATNSASGSFSNFHSQIETALITTPEANSSHQSTK